MSANHLKKNRKRRRGFVSKHANIPADNSSNHSIHTSSKNRMEICSDQQVHKDFLKSLPLFFLLIQCVIVFFCWHNLTSLILYTGLAVFLLVVVVIRTLIPWPKTAITLDNQGIYCGKFQRFDFNGFIPWSYVAGVYIRTYQGRSWLVVTVWHRSTSSPYQWPYQFDCTLHHIRQHHREILDFVRQYAPEAAGRNDFW